MIEIFSHVGNKHLRELFNTSDGILIDPDVHRVYLILKRMGLAMHFSSEELYRHVSLDVTSIESLTK